MSVSKIKSMPMFFLLLSLMLAPLSHAASLGSLNLSSNLGEPLLAEVEVLLEPQESLSGLQACLLYTSPSPRDRLKSRMPSSA